MASKARSLALLLAASAAVFVLAEELVELPSFKLDFPASSGSSNEHWHNEERAVFQSQSLVLTSGTTGAAGTEYGFVWHAAPLESDSFEAVLTFSVTSKESGEDFAGEGMILAFASEKVGRGATFGFDQKLNGLAIILDTKDHDNLHNNPAISAHMLKGLPFSHADDGISQQLAGCIAGFRQRSNPVVMKTIYEAHSKSLTVLVDLRGKGAFQRCMSVANVELPKVKYIGIAAMSAGYDRHEVYNFEAYGTMDSALKAQEYLNPKSVKETINTESDTESSNHEVTLEQLSKIAHERLNKLLQGSGDILDVHQLGQALDEIETNLVSQMNTKFAPIIQSLLAISEKQSKFGEQISALRQNEMPRFQSTMTDINRKIAEIPGIDVANSKLIDQVLGKLESTVKDMVGDHVRRLEGKISNLNKSSSWSSGMGFWVIVICFQVMFAIVVAQSYFNQRKDLKLL